MNEHQRGKVNALVKRLSEDQDGVEALKQALEASGMSLMTQATVENFPECDLIDRLGDSRFGIILDAETTGLEADDEVVELAMLRFQYDEYGILNLREVFNGVREPSKPMSEEAARVTGITAQELEGQTIRTEDITRLLDGVDIVVAHHAAFDRKMVERTFPDAGFDKMAWHCSMDQVDWSARGEKGRSLEVLALNRGYVYGSHRADADVIATAFVLSGDEASSPFSEMLKAGSRDTIHIIAKDSPFSAKDALKAAGFKWAADGADAYGHKAWHKEVPDRPQDIAEVADLLRSREVYGKEMALPSYRVSPETRYSGRKPETMEYFRTAEAPDLKASFDQLDTDVPGLPGMG